MISPIIYYLHVSIKAIDFDHLWYMILLESRCFTFQKVLFTLVYWCRGSFIWKYRYCILIGVCILSNFFSSTLLHLPRFSLFVNVWEIRYHRNEIFHANRIKLEQKNIHTRFLNPCRDQIVIVYTRDTKLRTVLRESCSRLITGFLTWVTPLVTLQE